MIDHTLHHGVPYHVSQNICEGKFFFFGPAILTVPVHKVMPALPGYLVSLLFIVKVCGNVCITKYTHLYKLSNGIMVIQSNNYSCEQEN
jgi:hypothetical protein